MAATITEKDKAYWQKRFEEMNEALLQDAMDYYDDVERMYREAMNRIEKDIAQWYMRLAENNGISYADARKLLTKSQLKDFKMTLDEYIRKGKENGVTDDWRKELENASAKFHISRLEAIKLQLQQHLETLYGNQLDKLDEAMRETYRNGYYQTAYELQQAFHTGFDVQQIDEDELEKILAKPWAADGSNFSDRIWSDKQKMINTLQNELIQGLVRGDGQLKITQRMAKKMNTSLSNAGRLIATEGAYFASLGEYDSMKAIGVEQYDILATLDNRTSDICRSLDGKTFKMSEFKPGVTAPPFHPWCRSCTVPHMEGLDGVRAARGEGGKTVYVPADMTYADWTAIYVDKSKTLEAWQEDKKNAIIKEKLTKVLVAAGIKFEIVHYPPKPIVSSDLAFDDTHINQERQHGVTLPVAQDIIDTALFSLTGWNGRSGRYYAMLGAVYVLDGCIRTAFLENEFDDKIKEVLRRWEEIKSDAP